MTVGRVVVLWLALIAGILCIYFGWSLYKNTIISKTTGNLSYGQIKIAIAANGPGIFLAAFGAYIIHSTVSQKLELTSNGPYEQHPTSSFSQNENKLEQIKYINHQIPTKCLVFSTRKSLLLGNEDPTKDDIKSAIDASISALSENTSARKHVITLNILRAGVENDNEKN